MATTRYRIAATPSNAEKVVSSLKAARVEADNRAKLDRVDVTVTTVATGKLAYTAQGAVAAPAPAPQPEPETEAPAAPAEDTAPAEDGDAFVSDAFDAELAEILSAAAPAADEDEDGSQDDQEDSADDAEPPAADDTDSDASNDQEPAADDNDGHRGHADCGCPVEQIIENGVHGQGCKDAPKAQAAAEAVKRDQPAARARRTGGGSRSTLGPSVVDGWELLYDKPRQKAQVGKNADGKYALICTTHKHAHPLQRLTQERGLRGGSRTVWCPNCK